MRLPGGEQFNATAAQALACSSLMTGLLPVATGSGGWPEIPCFTFQKWEFGFWLVWVAVVEFFWHGGFPRTGCWFRNL